MVLIEKYNPKPIYYVYIYLDIRKPGIYEYVNGDLILKFNFEPFYVGKGHKDRYRYHLHETLDNASNKHKTGIIEHIKQTNNLPIIEFIKTDMFEIDSYSLEIKCIRTIGRSDLKLGPLSNQTDGGEGVVCLKHTDEWKFNMSESMKGEKNHFFGKAHSRDSITILKNKHTGKKQSEETKQKKSEAVTGGKNPMSIKLINPDGKIFDSCAEAAKAYGLSTQSLSNMLCGRAKNRYNLVVVDGNSLKKLNGIKIIDSNGEIFNSISETANKKKYSRSTIINMLKGRTTNRFGLSYYQEYADTHSMLNN